MDGSVVVGVIFVKREYSLMNERSLLPERYHRSSPSALNGLPRFSDRLSRARGFEMRKATPSSSSVSPRLPTLRTPELGRMFKDA